MAKWEEYAIPLAKDHAWKATEGFKLCVVSRGELIFEFPRAWWIDPREMSIKVANRKPPADDYCLEVSVIRYPASQLNTPVPSIALLLQESVMNIGHLIESEDLVYHPREDIEIVWGEYRDIDEIEKREVIRHSCFTHCVKQDGGHLYGFLTYGFWPEKRETAEPLWQHILNTLIMDRPIKNPSIGPRIN